ncbi:Ent-kaurene oxidase [Neolecta irregularis DAH-3]|uniref:Ent-kaurene oxidase n=1 Tax=Neolecta irregularis (strain DAH-3) TaxID=1198029 RepID=A0A1U7LS19_NEOID|nr:Ent-kaurene oxidase [Neolecta irregularis DAH-3]|eukprot:OLL25457.1 Ent-kaurene oxidase [Neolecta irregularis DAH-3]
MIWEASPLESFPNARWFSDFWMKELDFPAHGTNLLWRIITENSGVKCLQKNPLFPVSENNPVVCALDTNKSMADRILHVATMPVRVAKNVIHYNTTEALIAIISVFVLLWIIRGYRKMLYPPILRGLPLFGMLLRFVNQSKYIVEDGIRQFGGRAFGFKIAGLKYFISRNAQDIQFAADEYDAFSVKEYFRLINFDVVVGAEFFESEIYTMLIRENLLSAHKLSRFSAVTEDASKQFLRQYPFDKDQKISRWLQDYMIFVLSRMIIGGESYDEPELLRAFRAINDDSVSAMGFASLLPRRFKHLAGYRIRKHLQVIRKILIPVIKHRRKEPNKYFDFLKWILQQPISNEKTSDLVAIILYVALTNLISGLPNAFYDIIEIPGYQDELLREVKYASVHEVRPQHAGGPWNCLRGSIYESLRMASQMTGPARLLTKEVNLPSDPKVTLPVGSVFSLSAYLASYNSNNWGSDWDTFKSTRFHSHRSDRYVNAFHSSYLAFGLGRNMCPGRFFGVQTIMIMLRELMIIYEFETPIQKSAKQIDKYTWKNGQVIRKEVQVLVVRR